MVLFLQQYALILITLCPLVCFPLVFPVHSTARASRHTTLLQSSSNTDTTTATPPKNSPSSKVVAIIGAGWGGLSAAHTLASQAAGTSVVVLDASPRVGGLVRDGFTTRSGQRPAEAGQHGFWNNYHNIYRFLEYELEVSLDECLTEYAEQGQYSPNGLEAVWPVYRNQQPRLPTGLAQAAYTRFLNLPWVDLVSAFPLVAAFSEFDNSKAAWESYDELSFRDLCVKLGVSKRCYDEAFEPMILTGLFAPGNACSAAAALGMAYFFVLQSQSAFDVQWCRGNIGEVIFDPWVKSLTKAGVDIRTGARVKGVELEQNKITSICYESDGKANSIDVDSVVFAVGAKALNGFARFCPELAQFPEFQAFANLRGTSVLATRIFLDRKIDVPYSANACWGFDEGVGMTMFDISTIHGDNEKYEGTILEVDYYHSNSLLVLSDSKLEEKVKSDVDKILGSASRDAKVVDAAIVRLPEAVNWYFPGSHKSCPSLQSSDLSNVFFAGDLVKTTHGAWSQEKAFVTGRQAANLIARRDVDADVLPVGKDEMHVQLGRDLVRQFQSLSGPLPIPKLTDFLR